MKISVIGTGYVGLVTAACLAEIGHDIICIDNNQKKIRDLNIGLIPIYEPGLEEVVLRNTAAGRLTFTTSIKALAETEIVFIAVGTPSTSTGHPDLTNLHLVVRDIGDMIKKKSVIVIKSTVPIGTAKKVRQMISERLRHRRHNIYFSVVSNPEFLKEGTAVDDCMHPDRIVLGITDAWAEKKLTELYAPFSKEGHQIVTVSCESAEMSKYAANAMLATKISFMNQIADLCEILGADIEEVRTTMTLDPRIGTYFLNAGVGYGGSCFPKDVQALNALADSLGHPVPLLAAVEKVNQSQKKVLPEKIINHFKNLKNKRFALWGLAFKPNTDDIREAPSITIIESLLAAGARLTVYDPQAAEKIREIFGTRIDFAPNKYIACRQANAVVLVTEWSEFREPDFKKMKKLLKTPILFDGRNVYDRKRLEKMGWKYFGIGR